MDGLLTDLIEWVRDAQDAQGRLRDLLRAYLRLARAVDLDEVLRRVVESARDLVDACDAALAIVQDGRCVHAGVDDPALAPAGHLPQGEDVLGVPIRVGDRVFGTLYLTRKQGAAQFTSDQEELVRGLAAAAGVAIENATLFAQHRRRETWQAAMVEVTTDLLAGDDPAEALRQLVHRARVASGADGAGVSVPTDDPERLRIAVAEGTFAGREGETVRVEWSASGVAISEGRPVLVTGVAADLRMAGTGPGSGAPGATVAVPMVSDGGTVGVLLVARAPGQGPFDQVDIDMIATFAAQAALAVQLAEARRDHERLRLVEDRQQIAEDLQHRVIARLFALGLTLQGVVPRVPNGAVRATIGAKIEEIDVIIREIRATVFALDRHADPELAG
jgi:GAF domain-containing protein